MFRLPRPALQGLAALYVLVMVLYGGVWMHAAHQDAAAFLGVELEYLAKQREYLVRGVGRGSGAEAAGVRAGDAIVAIDGRMLATQSPFADAVFRGRPGDRIRLSLRRGTEALELTATLGVPPSQPTSLPQRVAEQLLGAYPVLFLGVAVPVLLLRPDDRNAWLLALLFSTFIATAPYFDLETHSSLRRFCLFYKFLFNGVSAAAFLYVFSVFPAASPLERRLPWLKWLWLVPAAAASLRLASWAAAADGRGPILAWADGLGPLLSPLLVVYFFGGYLLGLVSLVSNAFRGAAEVRRKSRVILWGMLAGLGPGFLLAAAGVYLDREPYAFPFWVWAPCVIVLWLMPLSFAYAVVRHRVLELPVLLRRSARYLLVQRGSMALLLLLGAGATTTFAAAFGPALGPEHDQAGIGLGVAFGTLLVWSGTRLQRRLSERIDRAFFRSAYDARHVLQDLAERARGATSREELAALVEHHVGTALLPRSLALFFEAGPGELQRVGGPERLRGDLPLLLELARKAQPRELPPPGAPGAPEPGPLLALAPDCLVPILGREGRLLGLLVLGPRLSEEPYSGEDKRLLASVAGQVGIALESLRLAEQIAERLEADRRAAHEMELAVRVQRRLLPQEPPRLATLECAGRCVQARAVGGDYYDFLEMGEGRIGIALADIAGKGFPAALIMANLHATLRSRTAAELLDLPRQLESVNQLLFRFTETSRYATLFLGIYDDRERRLVYANCGHPPALLLRADDRVERLGCTAPALGLFEEWSCATGEVRLDQGDVAVIYSDGITEAWSDAGEEFGEQRLVELLRGQRRAGAPRLLDAVLRAVGEFSGREQEDDQTLVVARAL